MTDDTFTVINRDYLADEADIVERLLPLARPQPALKEKIEDTARSLAENVRARQHNSSGLHAFLNHYDLSSHEGVVLMCLAEALLRIPDAGTMDVLIADKLNSADWERHLGKDSSLFVNASTWGLMLTGKLLYHGQEDTPVLPDLMRKLLSRLEQPVLRAALKAAMKIMADEFVLGRNINEAIRRSRTTALRRYRFSYDMLGEAALTNNTADCYEQAYAQAIETLGAAAGSGARSADRPGISVKLSSLCPRFEPNQSDRAIRELTARMLRLCAAARAAGIALTIDAEETERLEMSIRVFERLFRHNGLRAWSGLGVAVQAYQKRAMPLLGSLNRLADEQDRIIPVRLVKGAYWDMEIKRAQEQGLADFPVFTLKRNTDVSYLACARYLLAHCPRIYPQFATHNAHTVSYIHHHAGEREFEFQRLYGMGEELYAGVTDPQGLNVPCRVYAPVGAHEDLLPYLVRRLLENGANVSFINRVADREISVSELVADPVDAVERNNGTVRHPRIPAPPDLFRPERKNSRGLNFADHAELTPLFESVTRARRHEWTAFPMVNGKTLGGKSRTIFNPADIREQVGRVWDATPGIAAQALTVTAEASASWRRTTGEHRAGILEKAADIVEAHLAELAALCVLEAGKCLRDAHDDVREAIDFLRYYAGCCRRLMVADLELPGPAGETNNLQLCGRGVFVCISPWNFPVAIYTGQIAAALAAGNTVIAKPAEQATLVAYRLTGFLYEAGIPKEVLAFLPGTGPELGNALLYDPRVAGVAFTGSTETARHINLNLAARNGPLANLIAETGGINAMLVDSSALPEQVVRDAVQSAFNSAGQRCSALRVLCLQNEIAERVLKLLVNHMDEWVVGDPARLDTDMGPVIDLAAQTRLEDYISSAQKGGRLIYRGSGPSAARGWFVPPAIIEIQRLSELKEEIFGPVLHVLRYDAAKLDALLDRINGLGYGLTLGIQSRIEQRAEFIRERIRVGNVYVNRNMVGAVVGVQPFGGCGLSGTGPKAGGPHYLLRFTSEQTHTVNTAAIGGNAGLLTM
ncbi:MAG: bifunctional proline dehydrogenase/L-glutamate gamma-semialdehyde dehydrogenase PutA [Gammaproteobacteria bacterium]|nr:bifunctional proline dehydrogenase/L-glutamate gamma-semialdehyde dehydrogenase PutA [Gammaproteobacteria bacterium]MDE0514506.1 bifunctional proline dehydrogenase/L-glutamate gamma-semialdehyde dehydrogenase PutA [Gammaproteobacteria bacterium]